MNTLTRQLAADLKAAADVPEFRRIAVLRALHLGDLLLAVPALRSLRGGFPSAEITLIGLPWATEFVRHFSHYLDRFVAFGGYPGIAEVLCDPERTAHFLTEQREYGYDLVIQMHGSGRTSNPCALALGGAATVGYYEGAPQAGLTVGAPYPDDRHEILRNLGLVRLLGCGHRGLELEFPLFESDRAAADLLLNAPRERRHPADPRNRGTAWERGRWGAYPLARPGTAVPVTLPSGVPSGEGSRRQASRPWIGLHPGARPPARRWPPEYFAQVADHFAQRVGARIIVTGGPGEEPIAAAVASRMAAEATNIAGATSLGSLAAVIDTCDLFISNDTGPAHLAAALDVPSVTICGPVDPRRWAPLDHARHPIVRRPVACSPCSHWECPIDHRCLRWIEPADVIEAGERLLERWSVRCGA